MEFAAFSFWLSITVLVTVRFYDDKRKDCLDAVLVAFWPLVLCYALARLLVERLHDEIVRINPKD